MSDTGENGLKRPSEAEGKMDVERPPDIAKKRPRGPSDCLSWEDSDEEVFTPFTQENPEPKVVKVFAKKSVPKKAKSGLSKNGGAKVKGVKKSSDEKGKSSGKLLVLISLKLCYKS